VQKSVVEERKSTLENQNFDEIITGFDEIVKNLFEKDQNFDEIITGFDEIVKSLFEKDQKSNDDDGHDHRFRSFFIRNRSKL